MADHSSSFDSQNVQYKTRRRIAYHTGIFGTLILLSAAVLLLITTNVRHPFSWLAGIGTVCLLPIAYLGYRIYRLSQIVWYVKISPDHVEGYDYARRKIRVQWPQIKHLEITNSELTITTKNGRFLTLPPDFADFAAVGHLLFDYSQDRDIPVYIDGVPWHSLSAYTLFPFLEDDEPAAF